MTMDMAHSQPLAQTGIAALMRAVANGLLIAVLFLSGLAAADAMPVARTAIPHSTPDIVKVLTTCDTRGCFTFGPRQSYHRPNYRPVGPIGPGSQSPRAARPPRFIFRPQPSAPRTRAQLPAADPSFHRQNCMNRYRSYNPLTDSYIGSGEKPVRCVLSERR